MIQALRALRHGLQLRHLPVALDADVAGLVEVRMEHGGRETIVSGREAPVSLIPFRIGVLAAAFDNGVPPAEASWEVRLATSATRLGTMDVRLTEVIELDGLRLACYAPSRARNLSVGEPLRLARYCLADRHARLNAHRPGLRMAPGDLRALDVYYIRPRPVYLVTVPHDADFNIFPMDLVDFVDRSDQFTFALRTSSPSVEFIKSLRRVAFSSVPAHLKEAIYRLGEHHKTAYDREVALPLDLMASPSFGLPVPASAFRLREMLVRDHVDIGSHSLFLAGVVEDTIRERGPQLAHVSALFAHSVAGASCGFVEA